MHVYLYICVSVRVSLCNELSGRLIDATQGPKTDDPNETSDFGRTEPEHVVRPFLY